MSAMEPEDEFSTELVLTPWERLKRRFAATGPYWLTRFVVLRFLGLVYLVAFLTAAFQLVPLVGEGGLTPIGPLLEHLVEKSGGLWAAFVDYPTLFLFGHSDVTLAVWSWIGALVSALVLAGYANALLMAFLWFLYLSINQVGQVWYGFGWEIQLLETGFLAIFLCPLLDGRPFSAKPPPKGFALK